MPKRPNVASLSKATPEELRWLTNHRCRHGHLYTSHFGCFLTEQQVEERIGCLDIECGSLKANVDIMLSWAIKTVGKKQILHDAVTPRELRRGEYDKRIVSTCIDAVRGYDRLVFHFGKYFDIPFLRTRALVHNLKFPSYGEIWYTDTWAMAKKCLCLSSNRQDVVAETILGENIKTRVNFQYWVAAKYGNDKDRRKALDYIIDHNLRDVKQLEANYLALRPFVKETRTSI